MCYRMVCWRLCCVVLALTIRAAVSCWDSFTSFAVISVLDVESSPGNIHGPGSYCLMFTSLGCNNRQRSRYCLARRSTLRQTVVLLKIYSGVTPWCGTQNVHHFNGKNKQTQVVAERL